jgi:predicted AAA+ superfamily ATPase
MGAVTEQFVGQNLLTLADPYADAGLYFWAKDVKQSQAEVDYLIEVDGVIYPVEVKSGKTGWLKSLKQFLKEHPKSPFGIRLSGHELSYHDHVLSIPLYAVSQLKRLVRESVK